MENEFKVKDEAEKAWHARQEYLQREKKIGPFSFCIDQFLDTEVLDKNQVFDDLVALEEILFNTNDTAQTNMTRGKRK